MPKFFRLLAFVAAVVAPATALAASIDASLIPDGTYTVKIEKVVDASHVAVAMDNGAETTLTAGRSSVTFGALKPNDSIKCSIIKGQIMVFLDLTSH